ncbi:MAG: MarR family transcriptional regulator [bacterium]
MFLLRDLPTEQTVRDVAKRYPDLDPSGLMSCIYLLRTGSKLLAILERVLSPYRLSQGGFLILAVLIRDPDAEISPSDLAEKIGLTRATITVLLDTLAKHGLIERIPHDGDRRRLVVRLTSKGRQHLDRMLPGYYRQVAMIMSKVSERERRLLMDILRKVEEGASEVKA